MIIIGVTPSYDGEARKACVNQDYMDSILRAGAMPFLFPMTVDKPALDEMLSLVDGVVFTGGADIDPTLYGEEKLPFCGELCKERDEQEAYLMRKALEINKPFLAICRGFELLNVVMGGTLYQDIEQQMSKEILHPRYEVPRTKVHEMNVVQGTLLHQVTGLDHFEVNSRHHQGVKQVGAGLVVNAIAPDGLVEGLELPEKTLALGIQWHPEALSDRYEEALSLFKLLERRAKEAKA